MARSSYVYVVTDIDDHGRMVAGFTVKWEMARWVECNPGEYCIYRMPDGGHREPEVIQL